MKENVFDILIVYTDKLATSPNALSLDAVFPFAKDSGYESYNTVYGYFLKICEKSGLKAAFSTSNDIIGAGRCQGFWVYKNNSWQKNKNVCTSTIIFDKFSPINKRIRKSRSLLFSSKESIPFNNPYIFELFFDKQKTYEKFHQFSIPTVTISGKSAENVRQAYKKLRGLTKKHPNNKDFSNCFIVKDRFGAGGKYVYKFKSNQVNNIVKTLQRHKNRSFVIQPEVIFDKGYLYNKIQGPTDIRLIYLEKKIIQTYIRTAKKGEFRCNEHRGGSLKYIGKDDIPTGVISMSNKVSEILSKSDSLYALDFIISNNGNTYLLEGNTGPGLDWDLSNSKNRLEAQRLIRMIVNKLYKLSRFHKTVKTKTIETIPLPIIPFGIYPKNDPLVVFRRLSS